MSINIETPTSYESHISTAIVEKFYLKEDFADFRFIFKTKGAEDERVPAHKLLLAASDVFRTMFNGDWKEKTEVEIVDASATVFKEFLQFFYLRQVNLTTENVAFVMNLGKKYDVQECLAVCSKFLTNSITNDNVCTAYGLARFFDQKRLQKYCKIFIGTSTKEVLTSNGFLECDRKALKCILDLDFISCSEANVFKACMNWVKFKSGHDNLTRDIVQEHLGELFKAFRFKSMSPQEFAMLLPAFGNVFSGDELVDVCQLSALAEFQPQFFSGKQRKSIDNLSHDGTDIQCYRLISKFNSSVAYQIKEVEVTTFSVSEPVLLAKIECVIHRQKNNLFYKLGENLATDLEIVQIMEQTNRQILYNQKANFECKDFTTIALSTPVLIRPNIIHEIRFKQSPPSDYVTGMMVKPEVQVDSNFIVKFHRDVKVKNDMASRGIVYRLIFKKI